MNTHDDIVATQEALGLTADGVAGPITWAAIRAKIAPTPVGQPAPAQTEAAPSALQRNNWPKEASAQSFFGYPPTLTQVVPPYSMRMLDGGKWLPITKINCNSKVAASLLRILNAIKAHYGTQEAIAAAGMDVFDGCYNDRPIRGNATGHSMHAYGAAIDFNAEKWPLGSTTVRMPQAVLDIFHAEGWRTGESYSGRKDPMHAEACQ